MSGDQFQYVGSASQNGSFSNPANWQNLTGSAATPGAGDSVTITVGYEYIYGDATLANITLTGSATFAGSVTSGGLVFNSGAGLSALGAVTITGPAQIGGGDTIGAYNGGAFTEQRTLAAASGVALSASAGGSIAIANLVSTGVGTGAGFGGFYVDSTSSIVIGSAVAATAGQIVIDAGQSVTFQSGAEVDANTLINNGAIDNGLINTTTFINGGAITSDTGPLSIAAYTAFTNTGTIAFTDGSGQDSIISAQITNNGSISIGAFVDLQGDVTGAGQFNIGAGGELFLEGSLGAGQTVAMTGENATLSMGFDNFTSNHASIAGAVTGFDQSDTVLIDQPASSASWSNGVLSVFEGTTVVETLNLKGNFAGASWIVGQTVSGGGFVTLAASAGDTLIAPAGTSSGDAFVSTGNTGKVSWDVAANWYDNTTGATAAVAPGANDSVEFDGTSASQIVTGVGQAASLIDNNYNLILAGNFSFGSATLNTNLAIDAGQVTVGSVLGGGGVQVQNGARFTTAGDISSNVNLSGGSMVVGGTLSLASFGQGAIVSNGGSLQVGGLVLGGFLNSVSVDSTSSLQVGAGGHVVAGELLVTSGTSVGISGVAQNLTADQLENDGTITSASGSSLSANNTLVNKGTVSGNASLSAQTVLTNSGQILLNGGGLYAASIQNTGVIGTTGYIGLSGAVTGTGEIDIDSSASGSATLSIYATDIAAGETIKMTGAASSLQLNAGSTIEAAITGFGIGDTITVATALTSATYAGTTLSLFNGSTLVETLTIGAGYSAAHFAVAFDGYTSTITTDSNAVVAVGKTYTLTKKADVFTGGAGNDTFVAAAGTLNAKDVIDGGAGTNTLSLVGGGKFDLRAPQTLANIQTLSVVEGAGDAMQTITLRSGLSLTVNVGAAIAVKRSAGDHLARAHEMEGECDGQGGDDNDSQGRASIRLIGGADSSVFNLGAGVDVVTLGSATETVHGGAGDALIHATAATAGALITGGAGSTTLDVTGGGAVTLAAGDAAIDLVSLDKASAAYSFTANAQAGLTVEDDSAGLDTLRAGGAGQTLTGGAAGKLTMIGSVAGGDTFRNTAHLFNGDTVGGFAAAGGVLDITDLRSNKISKATFVENSAGTGGTLTLAGDQSVKIALLGQFMAAGFSGTAVQAGFAIGSDGASGTNVTYHPVIAPGH